MHHVFVSYSRSDADWVTRLTRRLEAAGHRTWLDQRDIPMTLPWFEQIDAAVTAADLFLICDSPASRESANCGAEARLAFDAGKRSIEVKVGDDLATAEAEVRRAIAALDPSDLARTELGILARDWDRGGRENGALASARVRRRLRAAVGDADSLPPTVRAFLKASRKRSRRRAAVSALVAASIAFSALIATFFKVGLDRYEELNDAQAAAYIRANASLGRIGPDPYVGLSEAAALGRSESATDAEVIGAALATGVPDDGFKVPPRARRFADLEIGRTVRVVEASGRIVGRAAAARGVRAARPVSAPSPAAPAAAAAELRFERAPHGGVVDVLRGGLLWRRLSFSQRPQALALSPNGRELAAAGGALVEIADLRLGSVRTTLSGASGPVRDLAWSQDGGRLWALGPKLVVAWDVRDGAVLLDRPEARFEALLPAASADSVWAAGRDGRLRELDVGSGEVLATLRVPDEISSGGGATDGSVAALSGDRGLWIVPLDGGAARLMRLPGCSLGRPVFDDAETLYLPCIGADLLRISPRRRRIERRIRVSPIGVFAVRPLPRSRALLASDTFAGLFAVGGPGGSTELFRAGCGGTIIRIAAAANGRTIAPAGAGAGFNGCLRSGLLKGDDPPRSSSWEFGAVSDDVGSVLAEAAAVSRRGDVFAYGYSNGTVVLHPSVNLLPRKVITNVVGEIRDMHVTARDVLLVATAAGIVQRLPLCGRCLSNRSQAREARALLRRGAAIGTAVPRRQAG
jgi:hypothetical protein